MIAGGDDAIEAVSTFSRRKKSHKCRLGVEELLWVRMVRNDILFCLSHLAIGCAKPDFHERIFGTQNVKGIGGIGGEVSLSRDP